MKNGDVHLDEQTIAAYIADQLPADERAAVTAALVRDPDARELLVLAIKAMNAADQRSAGAKPENNDRAAQIHRTSRLSGEGKSEAA